MTLRGKMVLTFLFLVFCNGVNSLKDVKLMVEPKIVTKGGSAALICSRDMERDQLYSVKWYRGSFEFYRYIPNEIPNTVSFGLPGMYVDMNQSNGTQVMLRRLELGLAGNFSCEVTAESYYTQIAYRMIDIVAPPTKDPVLVAEKETYRPNEILRANCSSSPARPPANITIYINEKPHRASEMRLHPSESGLFWNSVFVELKVSPDLFPGGRLRVSCVASLYDVYSSTASLDFFTPETDPRPERITLNKGFKFSSSWIVLLLALLLPTLTMGQDLFLDEFGDFMSYAYDEESSENAVKSLIGM